MARSVERHLVAVQSYIPVRQTAWNENPIYGVIVKMDIGETGVHRDFILDDACAGSIMIDLHIIEPRA